MLGNKKKITDQEIEIPRHVHIWNNSSITIQNSQLNWETWIKGGILKLSDIIHQNSVIPFQDVKNKYKLKDIEFIF